MFSGHWDLFIHRRTSFPTIKELWIFEANHNDIQRASYLFRPNSNFLSMALSSAANKAGVSALIEDAHGSCPNLQILELIGVTTSKPKIYHVLKILEFRATGQKSRIPLPLPVISWLALHPCLTTISIDLPPVHPTSSSAHKGRIFPVLTTCWFMATKLDNAVPFLRMMRSAFIRNFTVRVAEEYDSATLIKIVRILPTSFRLGSLQDIEIASGNWEKMPDSQLAPPNESVSEGIIIWCPQCGVIESTEQANSFWLSDKIIHAGSSYFLPKTSDCKSLSRKGWSSAHSPWSSKICATFTLSAASVQRLRGRMSHGRIFGNPEQREASILGRFQGLERAEEDRGRLSISSFREAGAPTCRRRLFAGSSNVNIC